jgi:hypothetical protein
MRNGYGCWAYLPARSPGEHTTLSRLAVRRGFEPMLYGRQDFGPSSDYLLRNDWLSSLIGALLCRLGCGRGAPRDRALPGGLLGGAEVVRRMASHEPQRIP